MAELIPPEFQISNARRAMVERWVLAAVVAAGISGAGVLSVFAWQRQQAAAYATLEAEFKTKAVLVQDAQRLQARREDLASRMHKMQELQDDKVLLSLLQTASGVFTDSDRLEFVRIDAHPDVPEGATAAPTGPNGKPWKYTMRLRGITNNDTTHSQLMERLTAAGAKAETPIKVPLGEKSIEKLLAGEVTRYDVICEEAGK